MIVRLLRDRDRDRDPSVRSNTVTVTGQQFHLDFKCGCIGIA